MGKLLQLRLLLWKNFLLQIRRPISSVIEILLPIVACVFMIVIRQLIDPKNECFVSCQDVDPQYRASRFNVDNSSAPVVGYYPDTPLARSIMETASCMSSGRFIYYTSGTHSNSTGFVGQPFLIRAYNNTDLLEQEASTVETSTDVLGGIVFEGLGDTSRSQLPLDVQYAIRLRPSSSGGQNAQGPSWRTRRQTPVFEQNGVFHYVAYDSTFVPLQYMINQAITRVQSQDGGQCSPDHAQCPDVSELTTTCPLIADNGDSVDIQFASDSPQSITMTGGSLTCTCNRTSTMHSTMEIYSTNCSCNQPLTQADPCITNGPVDVTCCGRCNGTQTQQKSFLPMVVKNFPYPTYVDDNYLVIAGFMLGLLLVLTLIYPAGVFVKEIVVEKSSRLRETMKMMGLNSSLNFLSWFIKQLLFWLIACVGVTIIISAGGVFPISNGFLIFLFFLVYFISAILFLFMVSSWFSDPRVALISTFGLWFVTYVPYLALSARYDDLSTAEKAALCFFNINSALGMGLFQMSRREIATEGVQFSNAASGLSVEDGFSLAHVFGMLILNDVIYVLMLWYVENVFPGQFGVPKPFYFFLQKSYWLGSAEEDGDGDATGSDDDSGMKSEDHEEEPVGVNVGISIQNLRKVYQTGGKSKLAVDNLSLNMYSGQITSLLGHNGAGKTTTMSMLVGLFPPTSGDAFISGHSVRTDIEKIRTSLGLCPQHNVLYEMLTVHEHLAFFLELKTGRRGQEAEAEISAMIKDLQLEDKTNWQSRSLSGGMKRKLSVAIALIGGSKVVILDEPSSGMDPYARRATWDLLLKHKEGRTILLTTHFMDEADLLGDRIAIMSNGRLVCSGSSLFLKTRFGVGYHLVVVKENTQSEDAKKLLKKAVKNISGSRCVGDVGAEISFVLPHESAPEFRGFFEELEANKAHYGISNFGISVTTLEEVFHRVGETTADSIEKRVERQGSVIKRQYSQLANENDGGSPTRVQAMQDMDMTSDLLTGIPLWFQQFRAMFMKRLYTSIRHPMYIALQNLLPVALSICALLILKLVPTNPSEPDLVLNMANLKSTQAYTADFREGLALQSQSPLDANSSGRSYMLTPSLIAPTDIRMASIALQNGSNDCCGSENFILSSACIRERYTTDSRNGVGNLGAYANCPDTFGYKQCLNCLNPRQNPGYMDTRTASELFTGTCGEEIEDLGNTGCPAAPTTASAERRSTLFQARVLQGSNSGEYFKLWQSGYTLHSRPDDLPDSSKDGTAAASNPLLNCYHAVPVDCTKPNPADRVAGDKSDCAAFVANATCLRAYDPEGYGYYARIWYSAKSIHTLPYAVNTWSNMHLRNTLGNSSYTITTTNSPVPKTVNDQADATSTSGSALSFGIIATLGMSFLTASFAFNPVEEKQSKSKHVQFVSGVHISVYWMANYAWDLINYFVPLVFLLIVYAAFNISAFSGSGFGAVFVLLILFGWSGIPLAYLTSFLFSNPLVAYGAIAFFQFIFGLVYLVTIFALTVSSVGAATINIVRWVFYTLPHFCLAQGLSDVFSNYETQQLCNRLPLQADIGALQGRGAISREACIRFQDVRTDPFDWKEKGIGKECLYMAIAGFVYFALVILVEVLFHKSFTEEERPLNLQPTDGEDEDVAAERQRIDQMAFPEQSDDLVILKNLTKNYSGSGLGRPSADSLSLGIPVGECFGLLGVNGAGKTTTFNMLTGDILPSYGTAYLNGYNVRTDLRQVQQRIGYCPQFDALCEKLNAYELLTMYARLRGIPERRIAGIVDQAVQQLNLSKWADRQCGTYSGGNKRKLGAAIALVGDPPIVFLDEPTSGMDPGARRFLWDVLTNVMRAGRSIVLTSHSMEECEALCTRLAIMVNGQFKCLGSIQHLKSKFGSGYTIMLKVGLPDGFVVAPGTVAEPDTNHVQMFIQQKFPGAVLLEEHHGQLQYEVPGERLNLSFIFGELQENKEVLNIVDFSVSQTSLEQVFLNFARTQFTGAKVRTRSASVRPYSPNRPRSMSSPQREAALPRAVSPANITPDYSRQVDMV